MSMTPEREAQAHADLIAALPATTFAIGDKVNHIAQRLSATRPASGVKVALGTVTAISRNATDDRPVVRVDWGTAGGMETHRPDELALAGQSYHVATCAAGCAFASTVGDTACAMCGGPMTAPRALDAAGALALIRNDDAYQAGKALVLAWLGAEGTR